MQTGPSSSLGATWNTDPAAMRAGAANLDAQYPGRGAGSEFLSIAKKYPNMAAEEVAAATVVWLAEHGVGSTISQATQGTAGFVNTSGNATAQTLGGWSLNFGNTAGLLARILKVGFGAVLIISGVVHLSGADNATVRALKNAKLVLPS